MFDSGQRDGAIESYLADNTLDNLFASILSRWHYITMNTTRNHVEYTPAVIYDDRFEIISTAMRSPVYRRNTKLPNRIYYTYDVTFPIPVFKSSSTVFNVAQ